MRTVVSTVAAATCALLFAPPDAAPGNTRPPAPTLSGASYATPPPLVTITGTNLSGATVTIGGVATTMGTGSNATTIFATPNAAVSGTEKIVVTTAGGSADIDLTVDSGDLAGSGAANAVCVWTGSGTLGTVPGLTVASGTLQVNNAGVAIQGTGNGANGKGLVGISDTGTGVFGAASAGYAGQFNGLVSVNGADYGAVYSTINTQYGAGVETYGTGQFGKGVVAGGTVYGVYASSDSGIGVAGSANTGTGIYGSSVSGYAGQFNGLVYVTGAENGAVYSTTNTQYGAGVETYGTGQYGKGVVAGGTVYGVYASSDSGIGVAGSANTGTGIYGSSVTGCAGQFNGLLYVTGAENGAVYSTTNTQYGAGVETYGNGQYGKGVVAGGTVYGVYASSNSGTGVVGAANTGTGIYGSSVSGLAGQFNGNVVINGNLSVNGNLAKTSGTFKVDHPLDPENKYLLHSFVESPDMKNMYDGVAKLDTKGAAVVTLPAWFDALNKDFRYQLTAVGAPAPGLYVAEKVSGNRFRIAGGKPGAEVSWQVTGTRQDAYAKAHPILVEEEKALADRGYFLHPEAFGKAADRGIGAERRTLAHRAAER
jgi:hypothetical protein